MAQLGVPASRTAYAGDDLPDIGAIQYCQLGIAVANAHREVKRRADWICSRNGGNGAVREIADMLLMARGGYAQAIDGFIDQQAQ